jgi:hypothetical protein
VKKRKPLWKPIKAWRPHEWAPFSEAWRRVEATVGRALRLTQRDLHRAFLDGRLIAAVRRFAQDGTETWTILEPAVWRQLKINYAWSIPGWRELDPEAEQWVFFVRRKELDKLYPVVVAARRTEAASAEEKPTVKRKPGKKIKRNWKLKAAVEMHRFMEEEGRTPSAPELCQRIDKTLDYYPDESEMRKLIRFLLSE